MIVIASGIQCVQYVLEVDQDLGLVPYEVRAERRNALERVITEVKLRHDNLKDAVRVAKVLSMEPIVTHVAVTRVETSEPIYYSKGKEMKP